MRQLIFPLIVACLATGCVSSEQIKLALSAPDEAALPHRSETRGRVGARSDTRVRPPKRQQLATIPPPIAPETDLAHAETSDLVPGNATNLADVMSRLRQEGVVDGRAVPANRAVPAGQMAPRETSPERLAVSSDKPRQDSTPQAPAPLAEAMRNLATPLAAHVSPRDSAATIQRVSHEHVSDQQPVAQRIASYDTSQVVDTSHPTSPFETNGVAVIPVDTSISINNAVNDSSSIEIAWLDHSAPAADQRVERLPQPTAERLVTGQASLAIFQGPSPATQSLGWDPFEEDYPATAAPTLSRIAAPNLQEIPPSQPAHDDATQGSAHTQPTTKPIASGVVRFRDSDPPPKTSPMAKFRDKDRNSPATAQVAFSSSVDGSDKALAGTANQLSVAQGSNGLPRSTSKPSGSDQGAAIIRFSDSKEPDGPSDADHGSSSTPGSPESPPDESDVEHDGGTPDAASDNQPSGWKPVSPYDTSWRPTP